MKKFFKIILLVVSVVLLLDFLYSRYIQIRISLFNDRVERNDAGFIKGSEPFDCGNGRDAILFVHGFNDSPALWKSWVPFFAQKGFYCRAVRLPGSSEDLAAKRNISISNRVDFIKKEFDILKKNHDHVVLCAHSMGGAYAVIMTSEKIIEPDVLVLVAPMLDISTKRSLGIKTEYLFKLGKMLTLFTDTVENITPMDIKNKSIIKNYPIHPFIPISVYDSIFELTSVGITMAPSIHIPTIVMVSKNDKVVNSSATMLFYQNIQTDKKILFVDQKSGHVIPRDFDNLKQAEKILGAINSFLKKNK